MKSFIFLVALLGRSSAVFGDEYFIRHVNKYVNHSVSPCENFYRHVCPRKMEMADRFETHSRLTARDWIKGGAKIVAQTRNYTRFEEILLSLGGVKELFISYVTTPNDKDPMLKDGYWLAYTYRSMLERMFYMTAVPDVHMFAPRRLMHEIIGMAEKEIEISSMPYTDLTKERFRKMLATLRTESYDEYTAATYGEIFDNLDQFFQATGVLQNFEVSNLSSKASPEREKIVKVLGVYSPGLLNLYPLTRTLEILLDRMTDMNAAYYRPPSHFIEFNDPSLILSITASTPAKFGSAGFIMAHEMFHSILNKSEWTSDVKLGQHAVCLASHMEKICEVFREGNCSSGALTYQEDAADMEAMQLIFKMMRNKMGDELKKNVAGTNVTNEQMFFYANAVFNCAPEDADGSINHRESYFHPSGLDVHSYAMARTNGVPSLMKAFHDAFDCEAGDKMFDIAVGREGCNAFGEPVRK